MDKKARLGAIVAGAGKTAKELIDNTIQAVDQNDDGKFDLSDVSVIAEAVGNAAKKSAAAVKESSDERSRLLELKALQPIFTDMLDRADFLMSKFIRVVDRDKRYIESPVCQGSIGYTSFHKDFRLVNLFRDSVDSFGIMLYPDQDYDFYYIDPSERDRYIALDEYFGYLKLARVNELQKVAQDLGAKSFKVTYKEEQVSFSEKKVKAHTKAVAAVDANHEALEKKFSKIKVEAEMSFPGHAPVEPKLKYLQRDPTIQNLISMRMNENAPLHQKLFLEMSISSGMKESDAAKIDAVLKGLKCTGNMTVASEVKNESRRYLEYDIEF